MPFLNSLRSQVSPQALYASSTSASLYPFGIAASFTFTTGGQTGPTGPTTSTLLASYNTGTNPWLLYSTFFSQVAGYQGYQLWTVPITGT